MNSIEHLSPNEDERFFAAKIQDMLKTSEQRVKYSQFLDERRVEIAQCLAIGSDCKCLLFGGYDDAQRKMVCFALGNIEIKPENFPMATIYFTYKKQYALSHRDVLGTLMSIGIKRDAVGDILVGEGEAVVFVLKQLSRLILDEVVKIGGVGVTAEEKTPEVLPVTNKTEEGSGFSNSLRLDSIIAILINTGREKAKNIILAGLVKINGRDIDKPPHEVSANDKISIRGYGKYIISEDIKTTKRGRLRITFSKYI